MKPYSLIGLHSVWEVKRLIHFGDVMRMIASVEIECLEEDFI